ncbi:hypothetical protein [Ornithinimicrobium sp. W1665]|uniref:hypothetical protein n=1 Tax=Ornithinimicrobium sp. W1665 TaxID=3416666 RepID=UPI003D6BA3F4
MTSAEEATTVRSRPVEDADMDENKPVLQLRVVVEAEDFDAAVRFYRDVLGLPERIAYAQGADDRVSILEAGRATLEIASPGHKKAIDQKSRQAARRAGASAWPSRSPTPRG